MWLLGGLFIAGIILCFYIPYRILEWISKKIERKVDIYLNDRKLLKEYKRRCSYGVDIEDFIYKINHRQFEYFCANLVALSQGWKAEVTQATGDGGKDVVVIDSNGRTGYIECKHYGENQNVGIAIVQRLIGAVSGDNVAFGILITTDRVSRQTKYYDNKVQIINSSDICNIVGKMSKENVEKLIYNTKNELNYIY